MHVVLIDTEGFDLMRLSLALQRRLGHAGVPDASLPAEAYACLDRLEFAQCITARQLLLSLCALRFRIAEIPSCNVESSETDAPAMSAAPRVLLIDSLSRFQWFEECYDRAHTVSLLATHDSMPLAMLLDLDHDRGPLSQGSIASQPDDLHPPSRWIVEMGAAMSLLRQRVSVVWTRGVLVSRDRGYEFPALEPITSSTLPSLVPSHRLRLRLRPRGRGDALHEDVQLCFQSMLDGDVQAGTIVPVGGASSWIRHDLQLRPQGVGVVTVSSTSGV